MKRIDRLDALRVVVPCSVPWSGMEGDDRVRFCGRCRKNVYNVAAMTRAEALSLIERAEGGVCMQLTRRQDGTMVTGDCWAALRRARRRGILAFAAALPVVLAAQLWSQVFGLHALTSFFHRAPAPPPHTSAPLEPRTELPEPPAIPDEGTVEKGKIAVHGDPPARPRAPRKRKPRPDRGDQEFTLGGLVELSD